MTRIVKIVRQVPILMLHAAFSLGGACHFRRFGYFKGMWKAILSVPLLCASFALPAATVELKDKASVSGKILAEKPDEIVIDIGYTVLVIPKSQIQTLT